MKFRHELTYAASPADVYAMLSDPAFRAKVCEAQQVVSHDIDITPAGAGFRLVNDQVQVTSGLPAIAKKIAGDTTAVVITEVWQDPSGGTLEIDATGKPTSSVGSIRLEERDGGTVEVVELEVKVKVPLIAGKLETLMADQIRAGMDVEQTVGAAWLAGDR